MAEALLIGKGIRGFSSGEGTYTNFKTEIITANTIWAVPENIKNNVVSVTIFGGGGGGCSFNGGGGGGYMNKADLELIPGSLIQINIGSGGISNTSSGNSSTGNAGGSTMFGSYLTAAGGEGAKVTGSYGSLWGGNGGSGGGCPCTNGRDVINMAGCYGGKAAQFGGGSAVAYRASSGGSGGIWGGGGGAWSYFSSAYGGKGGTYGGGGGAWGRYNYGKGGNGGTYGGGGGCYNNGQTDSANLGLGRGGTYGGDGGGYSNDPNVYLGKNGINTSTWTNVDMLPISIEQTTVSNPMMVYLRGEGKGGSSVNRANTNQGALIFGSGGGGYGGNGGNSYYNIKSYYACMYLGGGGGYGGHGGIYGGGGYGGNGRQSVNSDSDIIIDGSSVANHRLGGGGGYGPGADGLDGGGAGYFTPSIHKGGAAYSTYGMGGNGNASNGTAGVCIIQYYTK